MKVKNIVFSGFMAMVLAGACGAANAEIIVASQKYVDDKVTTLNTKDTELSGKITALENANADGGSVANAIAEAKQAGTNAQGAVNTLAEKMNLPGEYSDLSTALAAKEDTKNKLVSGDIDLLDAEGKVNKTAMNALVGEDTKFPTVGAAVEIANAKAQDVLANVSEVSANLGGLTTKVGEHTVSIQKLEGGDDVIGSVANAIKQSKDYADGLATNYDAAGSAATAESNAKAYADQAEADAIASAKQYTDSLATNYDAAGSAAGALADAKSYADGLVATEKSRAELAEQGLQTAIDAINNETDGILADAKAYADSLATNYDAAGSAAAAESNAVSTAKEYTDTKIGDLGQSANVVAYVGTQVQTVNTLVGSATTAIEGLTASLTGEETRAKAAEEANAAAAAAALKAAQDEAARAEGEESRIEGLVATEKSRAELAEQGLQTAIDAINNETDGILADAKAYTNSEMAIFYANAKDCVTNSESKNCIMSAYADASGNPVYVWIDLTAPAE